MSNIVVGISGPSCSGKTTVARLIHSSLKPYTTLLHEDDFYKPDPDIPNKTLTDGRVIADWDCADALQVGRLAETLRTFKETGKVEAVESIQHQQGEGSKLAIDVDRIDKVAEEVKRAIESAGSPKILLVDGFLLYGINVAELLPLMDIKLLLSADYDTVKTRREVRAGYITTEGFWADPEGYVDAIVWPNYVADHKFMFKDEDVQHGRINQSVIDEIGVKVCIGDDLRDVVNVYEWAMKELLSKLQHI